MLGLDAWLLGYGRISADVVGYGHWKTRSAQKEERGLPRLGDTARAMSQENVEAVRAVYDEWEKGNFRAGVDLLDPDVLFMPRTDLTDAGRYLGREGVAEFMRGWLKAWRDFTVAAQEFIEAENSVVVAVRIGGIGPESLTPTGLDYFDVWTFRGRAVVRRQQYRDRADALDAVGLSEQDAHADP